MAEQIRWTHTVSFLLRKLLIVVPFLLIFSTFLYFTPPTTSEVQMEKQFRDDKYYCDNELMSFPSYDGPSINSSGHKFNCSFVEYLQQFTLHIDSDVTQPTKIVPSDVPFVIYASSNHFLESRMAILKLRELVNNRIIYYDLGLMDREVEDLKKTCNLEVVKFDFARYPAFVRQLMTYSFKPIIMAEMFSREPYFWVIDASTRFFNRTNMEAFYSSMDRGEHSTFLAAHPTGHSIYAATHPGMYDYLPLIEDLRKGNMYQALTMFVVRSPFTRDVIKWNLLCALTEDCMAPKNSTTSCNSIPTTGTTPKSVMKCHRFDQSSLNIILWSLWERDGVPRRPSATTGAFSSFADVSRDTSYSGALPAKC